MRSFSPTCAALFRLCHPAWIAALCVAVPRITAAETLLNPSGVELGARGASAAALVDSARVAETVRSIVGTGESRAIGFPGNADAIGFVRGTFETLGLERIASQHLEVPTARQEYAYALLPGESGAVGDTVALRCLLPNFARTNTIPPSGLSGELVYVHKGDEREYDGHELSGSIVLVEATAARRWRLAASLGARAAIFVESSDPRLHTGGAFGTSVNFPRFWVSREVGDRLRSWTQSRPGSPITLHARQPWGVTPVENVTAFLPGSDPTLASEVVIITAPIDAATVVDGVAPGAEASLGAAALVELCHVFSESRLPRSVYFAGLNGQFSGSMAGGRHFVHALKQSYPDAVMRVMDQLRKDIRLVCDDRLASKFPEYYERALQVENRLNAIVRAQHATLAASWYVLTQARAAYLGLAAIAEDRRGEQLHAARAEHAVHLRDAGGDVLPAFHATVRALSSVIEEFEARRLEFVHLLQSDRDELIPIIAEGEGKIRTSLEERLAAARLTDIEKALRMVTRISGDDHTGALEDLSAQLELIEPILGRYPALLIDLSLTSHSRDIGVFHKGRFYNQVPDLELKRAYGPIGKRFDDYATNVVVVNDAERLWSMSDDGIRALIVSKIDAINALRDRYRAIEHLPTAEYEEFHHYRWYHRVFNSTAWLWSLAILLACVWLGYEFRRRMASRLPMWYWVGTAFAGLLAVYAISGSVDWKHTESVYHGIDTLIREHTDLLVNAERIPREDKTKIRIAAERHTPYSEATEAPEFFANNIIAAIPATLHKLRTDSIRIAQQLVAFDDLDSLRTVPTAALDDSQLVALTRFMTFLGLRSDRHFINAVAGVPGKSWGHFLPGWNEFTSEIATLAGIPAVALSTLDDRALLRHGTHDRIEYLDMSSVVTQVRTAAAVLYQAISDPHLPDDIEQLDDYFAEAHGAVLFDDRKGAVAADIPVDSAIVIADRGAYVLKAFTNRRGAFDIYGLPIDGHSWSGSRDDYWLHAYKADVDSGHIFYAVDLGSEQYAFTPAVNQRFVDWMLVVFPCASVSVTNMMDHRYMQYLAVGEIYDARTDAKPWHSFTHIRYGDNTFFIDAGTQTKLLFKQGLLGVRAMLTNVPDSIERPEHRQGLGFPVVAETLLTHTTYRAARDMWELDDARLATLIRHGIIDEGTRDIHQDAREGLERADEALSRNEYSTYLTNAREALALESRVLPDILNTANGALKGVLFYMALLLPFAFFLERLLIGSVDVRRQVLWFFSIFITGFVLIEQVHPAFDIAVAPPMVLLAFTVFALSVFVVGVIIGKFTAQMQQIRKEQQGYLSADVGRMSAMFTAFVLGVSNMRKRKVRTALTCTTLIILTFTVLSFTSVQEILRVNRIELTEGDRAYTGVLIRDRSWNFWPSEVLPAIKNEFGGENIVVGRKWREAVTGGGAGYVFTLRAENGKHYTLSGFVGMEPQEDEVTGVFRKAGVAGRWFTEDDLHVVVIPRSAADALDIALTDVTGDRETSPKITFQGVEYAVVGVVDDESLRLMKDLDGEDLTSVDWTLAAQQRVGRLKDLAREESLTDRETFIHHVPAQCMFMPLRSVYGGLVSIAIKTPTPQAAAALIQRVIPKWALEMYSGEEEATYLYSAIGLTTLGGLGDVLIPILIAALIVLNTMLSAVYERTREIGIFSAVGLAPSHIAMLFMAEAAVYAVLGAIAGYLLGQTVGQLVYKAGILGAITLNYSSLSAVASTIIVMVTVLLSTIWPAKKASELAVPDITRTWRLPDPEGDDWYFALPFTLLDDELEGVNAFLTHYLEQHHDESASDFYIDRVEFWVEQGRFMLETAAWLAPYDLGVSELVTLITAPVPDEKGLYQMSLLVTRESGDVPSWVRVNRRFVNFLRKQFLVWRALTPVERAGFVSRGREMFMIDGHRAVESTDTAT